LIEQKERNTMIKKTVFIAGALIVAVILYVSVSVDKFREKVDREVFRLKERAASAAAPKFTYASLDGLPEPVQRYFRHVLQDGREYIRMTRITQTGEFRATESAQWVPLEAEHYYALQEPSYVSHIQLKPMPYVWIETRDMYHDGKGFTEGKLFSAFPLMFEAGRELELSSLARFLSEAPWYPTALLPAENLEWQGLDSHSARAVIHDAGYSVSAIFDFDDNGRIIKVTIHDRYRKLNGRKERLLWAAHYKNYQEHNGINIPTEVESEWQTEKGAFPYARVTVREVRYQ
jgi:hypothetical protein